MEKLSDVKRPESPEKIQAMFSSVAKHYDLANSLMSFGLHYRWKRFAVQQTGLREGDTALDVCSGTHDIAILLAKIVGPRGAVTALDFNADMLEVGKYKVAKEGLTDRITSIVGDAHELPFPDSQFNAVTIAVASRHLHLERAISEFSRVLKPGGRFVCLEFFQPPNPLFRRLYNVYSYSLMPRVGTLVTGDKTGVYHYLPDSIRVFPTPERFRDIIAAAGLTNTRFDRLTGGVVCVHVGEKNGKDPGKTTA